MVHAESLINGSENSTEPFILDQSVLVCTLSSRLNYITDSREGIQTAPDLDMCHSNSHKEKSVSIGST